jgi:hypothetical protein
MVPQLSTLGTADGLFFPIRLRPDRATGGIDFHSGRIPWLRSEFFHFFQPAGMVERGERKQTVDEVSKAD